MPAEYTILTKKDDNGNTVKVAPATYADLVAITLDGSLYSLTQVIDNVRNKNSLQDQELRNHEQTLNRIQVDLSDVQSTATAANERANANSTTLNTINGKFGPVTRFNSGTAEPTYSCADGEVYFQYS